MHNLRNWHYWHNMHNLHYMHYMHLPQHCALPPHSSGRKALDYSPKRASLGGLYSLLAVSCIMCMTSCNVRRYFIRSAQPVYGFWLYYMWENVVGPALEDINPKLHPKTASEMDELLAIEIGMYVCPPRFSLSTRIICIICIIGIIGIITCIISYQ